VIEEINEITRSEVTFVIVERTAREFLRAAPQGYVLDLTLNRIFTSSGRMITKKLTEDLLFNCLTFSPILNIILYCFFPRLSKKWKPTILAILALLEISYLRDRESD